MIGEEGEEQWKWRGGREQENKDGENDGITCNGE
jgi:hypothetical protein